MHLEGVVDQQSLEDKLGLKGNQSIVTSLSRIKNVFRMILPMFPDISCQQVTKPITNDHTLFILSFRVNLHKQNIFEKCTWWITT